MPKSRWTIPAFLLVAAVAWPLGTWAQSAVQQQRQPHPPAGHAMTRGEPGPHGAAKAAHGEGGEEHGPGEFNFAEFGKEGQPPFIAVLINFAILAGGYYYFGKKPIADALKARKTEITKEIDDAQRIKREAEERAKVYEDRLASLETELAATRAALVEAGKGERTQIVAEAEAKAERLKRDTEVLISQEIKQQTQLIWRDAVDAAVGAAEELLRTRVTPADHERLAEEFLRELSHKPAAAHGKHAGAEVAS